MNPKHKILELQNINAGYEGKMVLRNVNLEIFNNDFIGIIGPNGGGKTTLVKVMLGLIKPLEGKVNNFVDNSDDLLSTGYLPQISEIDKKFPILVFDVILSGFLSTKKYIQKYNRAEKERVNEIMDEMGIYSLKKRTIGELSGGQLQRVFLARAIISRPQLLILDEPNTYVDNKFEGELYEKLSMLNESMAIVIVSHDIGIISTYIKTIACVNEEVHYHRSNVISQEQLDAYNCPIQLITHGDVPHTVLHTHEHDHS
jgi:zinc transport system ATP-binding protein